MQRDRECQRQMERGREREKEKQIEREEERERKKRNKETERREARREEEGRGKVFYSTILLCFLDMSIFFKYPSIDMIPSLFCSVFSEGISMFCCVSLMEDYPVQKQFSQVF